MKNVIFYSIYYFGYIVIVFATFYKREGSSEIKLFSERWFLVVIMLIIGEAMICTGYKLMP
jgi:hypothetical protein